MTTWKGLLGWLRKSWHWLVAGLGLVFGVIASLALKRHKKKSQPVVPQNVNPDLFLPPMREIGTQAKKIKEAVHVEARKDAQHAHDAHDAIDAADSIDDVNDVLYGKDKR